MRVSVCLVAVVLVLSAGSPARADELAPGKFRIVRKGEAPEWKGGLVANRDWLSDRYISNNMGLVVTWKEVAPDDFGNKPVKYIVFFGEDAADARSLTKPEDTKAWFEGKGTHQLPWYLEVAADVHQVVDPNRQTKWTMWVAVQYSNGKLAPITTTKGEIRHDQLYSDFGKKQVLPNAVHLPEDLKWPASDGGGAPAPPVPSEPSPAQAVPPPKSAAPPAAGEPLKPGEFHIVRQGEAPEWKGGLVANRDWLSDRYISNNMGLVVTWKEVAPDDFGNKPVKYIVFFGEDGADARSLTKPEDTKAWFEGKGAHQMPWYLEVAADVHQVVDPNRQTKWTMWVAVQYSNGKLAPITTTKGEIRHDQLYSDFGKKQVLPNAVHLPEDLKWPAK